MQTDSTGGSKLSELLSDALAQRQLIQDLACILGGTERDTKGKARHEEKLSSLWGSGPYTFVTEVIARPISSSRSKKAAANGSSSFIGIAATPQPNDVFHPHYLMAAAGGRLPTPNRTYEGEMRGIGQVSVKLWLVVQFRGTSSTDNRSKGLTKGVCDMDMDYPEPSERDYVIRPNDLGHCLLEGYLSQTKSSDR